MFPRLCNVKWYCPRRETPGAAGYDLKSEISKVCEPDQFCSLDTGHVVAGNRSSCLWKIAERSGLALKYGIFIPNTVLQTPNITIGLFNGGKESFKINKGDRVAQLLTIKCYTVSLVRRPANEFHVQLPYALKSKHEVEYCKFNEKALTPVASDIGYILQCNEDCVIRPGEIKCVKTGLGLTAPNASTYWRVSNHKLNCTSLKVCAGVIDSDYRGEIGIVVKNISKEVFHLKHLDYIANVICEQIFIEDFEHGKHTTHDKNDLFLDFPLKLGYYQTEPHDEVYRPIVRVNGYELPLDYDIHLQPKRVVEWKLPIRIVNKSSSCYWYISSLHPKLFVLNDILDNDSIVFYNCSEASLVLEKYKCYVSIHCVKIDKPVLKRVKNFSDNKTNRNDRGFGSTGISNVI
jgi:dUTP pyrophosphatase